METQKLSILAFCLAGLFISTTLAFSAPQDVQTAFENSCTYYKRRIELGDSLEELEIILQRIKKKYAGASVNHTAVDRELIAVRRLKAIEARAAQGRKPGSLDDE